jgi:hypothetical protein
MQDIVRKNSTVEAPNAMTPQERDGSVPSNTHRRHFCRTL